MLFAILLDFSGMENYIAGSKISIWKTKVIMNLSINYIVQYIIQL